MPTPTLVNDVIAGLDSSVMAEISGAQLMQQVQELTVNLDRGFIFAKDDLPTVAELTTHVLWKNYLAIKQIDNPKVVYAFDVTKFNANTNPPWSPIGLLAGSVTNAMLQGGIQLSKLSINPAIPADAGKYVVVNGAGNGYLHQAFSLQDGSIILAKLSVSGGFGDAFIKIKADSTGYEFIAIDGIAALFNNDSIEVNKLYTGGTAGTIAKGIIVQPHQSTFQVSTLDVSKLDATGVPAGYIITSDGADHYVAAPPTPNGGNYAMLASVQPQGIGEGNAPVLNAWFTRTINTIVTDLEGIITNLSGSAWYLAPGQWRFKLRVPGSQIGYSICRLFDITANAAVSGQISQNAAIPNNTGIHIVESCGEFVIGGTTNHQFKVEQKCNATGSANGLGPPKNMAGENEVYSQIELWKVL